jgi:hypothetical protein
MYVYIVAYVCQSGPGRCQRLYVPVPADTAVWNDRLDVWQLCHLLILRQASFSLREVGWVTSFLFAVLAL